MVPGTFKPGILNISVAKKGGDTTAVVTMTVIFPAFDNKTQLLCNICLKNVYYIPTCAKNLISTDTLLANGFEQHHTLSNHSYLTLPTNHPAVTRKTSPFKHLNLERVNRLFYIHIVPLDNEIRRSKLFKRTKEVALLLKENDFSVNLAGDDEKETAQSHENTDTEIDYDDWQPDPDIVKKIETEYCDGDFDTEICCDVENNNKVTSNAKVQTFNKEKSCFSISWHGRKIWGHPPYRNPFILKMLQK